MTGVTPSLCVSSSVVPTPWICVLAYVEPLVQLPDTFVSQILV